MLVLRMRFRARAAQKGINPLVAVSVKRINGAHSEDRRRYERFTFCFTHTVDVRYALSRHPCGPGLGSPSSLRGARQATRVHTAAVPAEELSRKPDTRIGHRLPGAAEVAQICLYR